MVGPAFTLRYMPAREDRNQLSEFRNPQHPQRVAIETCPEGHVLVIDSRKDARGVVGRHPDHPAHGPRWRWNRHRRRLPRCRHDRQLDIHAYHTEPSSPTNLTLHEAIEINGPIGCGDAPVFPGDIIVGDDDCVIVIPAIMADEIAAEAVEMSAYEDFVVDRVKEGETIIGLYPCTKDEHQAAFAKWRQANGR